MTQQPPRVIDGELERQSGNNATRPYIVSPQKNIMRFPTWLTKVHGMQPDTITQEFQEMQRSLKDHGNPTDIWRKNLNFNRYADMMCFDNSRVMLSDGLQPDYIHANYVDGYCRKNAYILTQGPLDNTICDFWRMIWQEKVSTVVMVTRVVERLKPKCSRYFPLTNEMDFSSGAFRVTLAALERRTNCTSTVFKLTNTLNDETRKVVHVWYTCWPDQGIPDDVPTFRTFMNVIKILNAQAGIELANPSGHVRGPTIVIHCSAGIGRSAVVAILDTLNEAVMHRDFIDPLDHILKVRKLRYHAIHTKIQLLFIYDYVISMCIKWAMATDSSPNTAR